LTTRSLQNLCVSLPTGLFYAQGVKANVVFFERKPASETPWTKKLWIYDLRTNQHFTLKTNPLRREHLDEFVRLYNPANRHDRQATWSAEANIAASTGPDGCWRAYDYADLVARDKASLDRQTSMQQILSQGKHSARGAQSGPARV
jgi:type I restriction enzyme M protein